MLSPCQKLFRSLSHAEPAEQAEARASCCTHTAHASSIAAVTGQNRAVPCVALAMQRALLFRAPHACMLLLCCFAVTLLAPVTAKPSTLYISSPLIEADPLAICNDGSSQMYYFKQATHAKMATVWLVYLAPGLWCWNASSCALRLQAAPWDTGSSKWPATRKCACTSTICALLLHCDVCVCVGRIVADTFLFTVCAS